jgi:hypothetical protein
VPSKKGVAIDAKLNNTHGYSEWPAESRPGYRQTVGSVRYLSRPVVQTFCQWPHTSASPSRNTASRLPNRRAGILVGSRCSRPSNLAAYARRAAMKNNNLRRVTGANRCPVCGRPDRCIVALNGTMAICPRTPSERSAGEAGFLHRLTENNRHPACRGRTVAISCGHRGRQDLTDLTRQYRDTVDSTALGRHARQLGLSNSSGRADGKGSGLRFQATTVSRPLKSYGVPPAMKINGRRVYRNVRLVIHCKI